MGPAALDVYVRTFLARCVALLPPGRPMLDEHGIHGLLPYGRDRRTRLLVTDDRARDLLPRLAGDARCGMITVCAAAVQCAALLAGNPAWQAGNATAMISRGLQTVPAVALPCGLTLQPVRRLADDNPAGVPLTQAAAAASRADPGITDPQALADHLRSLPRAFGLWAAVDDAGVVRATPVLTPATPAERSTCGWDLRTQQPSPASAHHRELATRLGVAFVLLVRTSSGVATRLARDHLGVTLAPAFPSAHKSSGLWPAPAPAPMCCPSEGDIEH